MWKTVFEILALSVVGSPSVAANGCADIDTAACHVMAAHNANICSDPVISGTACTKFCNLCRIQCYHCNDSVVDFHECNTTKVCGLKEMCMRKTLTSTADGHREYQMTCESRQLCDGNGIVVSFGKRDVEARDLSVHCCSDDLCNYPPEAKTTPTPSACKKDVVVLAEVNHLHWSDVSSFLLSLVSSFDIGQNEALVSVAQLYSTTIALWDLNRYTDKASLQNATNYLQYLSNKPDHKNHVRSSYDMDSALSYILNQALTQTAGDRPNAENVIVILYEDGYDTHDTTRALASQLHQRSSNIITIGVGHHNNAEKYHLLSTDQGHEFKAKDTRELMGIVHVIAALICN